MRDEKSIQAEMAQAEADLQTKIGQLKDTVQDKVERVEKPVVWIRAHGWLVASAAAGLAVLWLVVRARRPAR